MEISKHITTDTQSGVVEASVTTSNGRVIEIQFSYLWDNIRNELDSIYSGKVKEGDEDICLFYRNDKSTNNELLLKVPDYKNLSECSEVISSAISELAKLMTHE